MKMTAPPLNLLAQMRTPMHAFVYTSAIIPAL
jgi:hypothetical protein